MTLTMEGHPLQTVAPVGDRQAALSMYDPPELRDANDALWSAIAERLTAAGVRRAPRRLGRAASPEPEWAEPDLLLSQTCGYPLVTRLGTSVQIVATPGYDAPGCDGPRHRSALVVRAADPAEGLADLSGRTGAINDPQSNSGMNLFRDAIAPLARGGRFFGGVVVTGAHVASVAAVVAGDADIAAVDCVTLDHLRRARPDLTGAIRVLGWTRSTPGLPLITGAATTPGELAALRGALADVLRDPALQSPLRRLRIRRFHALTLAAYRPVRRLALAAAARGYPDLV